MPRGGFREGSGRPKGTFKPESEKGRKTIFRNFTVSCSPEEYEQVKVLAEKSGKSISRFIVDSILKEAVQ